MHKNNFAAAGQVLALQRRYSSLNASEKLTLWLMVLYLLPLVCLHAHLFHTFYQVTQNDNFPAPPKWVWFAWGLARIPLILALCYTIGNLLWKIRLVREVVLAFEPYIYMF